MPSKIALVDFNKCRPESCSQGICASAAACERKLLQQEALYQMPMTNPSLCRGCGDCVRPCPLKAVKISRL